MNKRNVTWRASILSLVSLAGFLVVAQGQSTDATDVSALEAKTQLERENKLLNSAIQITAKQARQLQKENTELKKSIANLQNQLKLSHQRETQLRAQLRTISANMSVAKRKTP